MLAHGFTVHHGGKGVVENGCPEPPCLLRSRQDRKQRDECQYPAGFFLFLFEFSPGLQSMGGCCLHPEQILMITYPLILSGKT